MLRRLFFVVPNPARAAELTTEIERFGIPHGHIHALARDEVNLSALPKSALAPGNDVAWKIEWNLWKINLILFALSSLGFILELTGIHSTWAVFTLALMVTTCVMGALFAFYIPDTQLNEFSGALAQGEIVLMVDVPKRQVRDIETWVDRHYPDALCGIGWPAKHLGLSQDGGC